MNNEINTLDIANQICSNYFIQRYAAELLKTKLKLDQYQRILNQRIKFLK